MSTIYLIRHGQASFGADNYDVLSPAGEAQSRALGAYWARRGQRIDACYMGPRQRHKDTARGFAEAASQAGVDYPEPILMDGLDEYPAIPLVKRWLPELAKENPDLAAVTQPHASKEQFERAFWLIVDKWSKGQLDTGDLETYPQFHTRVRDSFDSIMADQGRKKNIAVFTSGGPICMAMQHTLGLSDLVALRAAWVISNGSVSEFRYRDAGQLTLVRFNTIPHLPDELITYR